MVIICFFCGKTISDTHYLLSIFYVLIHVWRESLKKWILKVVILVKNYSPSTAKSLRHLKKQIEKVATSPFLTHSRAHIHTHTHGHAHTFMHRLCRAADCTVVVVCVCVCLCVLVLASNTHTHPGGFHMG